MPVISRVHAREVLDSRGNPTVEAEVHCLGGAFGRAIAPSGASTGRHEALELRDGDLTRYGGRGVRKAVDHVRHLIAPALKGLEAADQTGIDALLLKLDGTPNKSCLGANALLAVSLASAHAAAAAKGVPLYRHLHSGGEALIPMPMINLISGGRHAGGNLDLQDFLLLPIGAASMAQALELAVSVYRRLGELLVRHGLEASLVGDEGGYGPRLQSNLQAVELVCEAIALAGLEPGKDAAIAIDVASTQFFREGSYHLKSEGGKSLQGQGMIELLAGWVDGYPILSIEDGLAEDDWENWRRLTERLGRRVQLIGDDLFATNPARLERGIQSGVANSVLVKPNQIGTLTETQDVIRLARAAGFSVVVSARSGETEDTTMADLAVASAADQIKIGCIVRGERLAKYNQLLRIEEELGSDARMAVWPTRFSRSGED